MKLKKTQKHKIPTLIHTDSSQIGRHAHPDSSPIFTIYCNHAYVIRTGQQKQRGAPETTKSVVSGPPLIFTIYCNHACMLRTGQTQKGGARNLNTKKQHIHKSKKNKTTPPKKQKHDHKTKKTKNT